MRPVVRWLADRIALVVLAIATCVGVAALFQVVDSKVSNPSFGFFIVETLIFIPAVGAYSIRMIRSRVRHLHRQWPMVVVGVLSLSLHAGVGFLIYRFGLDLKMVHWIVLAFVELFVFGLFVEIGYQRSV